MAFSYLLISIVSSTFTQTLQANAGKCYTISLLGSLAPTTVYNIRALAQRNMRELGR